MHRYGGFEGNAQTLRICTRLGKTYQEQGGLNLTRRTLLGLLKYPAAQSVVVDSEFIKSALETKKHDNFESSPYIDIDFELWKPAKCFYDSEKDIVEWIFHKIPSNERKKFTESVVAEKRDGRPTHRKTTHKSLDASIMDLSDDISYGVHDLEDAIHLELVKREDWGEFVADKFKDLDRTDINLYELQNIEESLFQKTKKWELKSAIGRMVNYFVAKSQVQTMDFTDPLLKYRISLTESERAFLEAVKKLVNEKVIKSARVQTLEFRGLQIITRLFEALSKHPTRLLSLESRIHYESITTPENKMRVISDYVATMTDDYATKLYERLFVPRRGSLFEKL